MPQTNILDRFNAWINDPDTPADLTLQDAFVEGFAQCMELETTPPHRSTRRTLGERRHLEHLAGQRCTAHREDSEQYFAWHRTTIFRGQLTPSQAALLTITSLGPPGHAEDPRDHLLAASTPRQPRRW
jgi:hypothetical protein